MYFINNDILSAKCIGYFCYISQRLFFSSFQILLFVFVYSWIAAFPRTIPMNSHICDRSSTSSPVSVLSSQRTLYSISRSCQIFSDCRMFVKHIHSQYLCCVHANDMKLLSHNSNITICFNPMFHEHFQCFINIEVIVDFPSC